MRSDGQSRRKERVSCCIQIHFADCFFILSLFFPSQTRGETVLLSFRSPDKQEQHEMDVSCVDATKSAAAACVCADRDIHFQGTHSADFDVNQSEPNRDVISSLECNPIKGKKFN